MRKTKSRKQTVSTPKVIDKKLIFEAPSHPSACICAVCKNNKKFDLPVVVADAFIKGDIILFVGAGVSTEAPDIMPHTFYEEICHEIGGAEGNPFPDVMTSFCMSPEGRTGLIQRLKARFDYIYAHEELYNQATRFHRELATLYPIDTIVTTNWDTYFEDECGATPFVEDKDLAFWNAAKRKVLKLHGTIANFGSIVATKDDYANCSQRLETGLLGAQLKSLLSTRTTIFIGYSLRDDDFLQIYNAVRGTLGEFHRPSYFVAPNFSSEDRIRLEALNLNLVETDGSFFIAQLKEHARSKSCIASDEMYGRALGALLAATEAHKWLHKTYNMHKHPQMLFSSWYQDGFMHSLNRILRLRKLGTYSDLHYLQHAAHSYLNFAKRYRADKKFGDAAYCYGYSNGYLYASLSEAHPTLTHRCSFILIMRFSTPANTRN
jgi:hypothetical protein